MATKQEQIQEFYEVIKNDGTPEHAITDALSKDERKTIPKHTNEKDNAVQASTRAPDGIDVWKDTIQFLKNKVSS